MSRVDQLWRRAGNAERRALVDRTGAAWAEMRSASSAGDDAAVWLDRARVLRERAAHQAAAASLARMRAASAEEEGELLAAR